MNGEYAALAARIRDDLQDVERAARRAEELRDKARQTGEDGYWDGAALNLHGFYTGIEQIFEDVARTVERSVPDSSTWHHDLLQQMSVEIAGMRPAVIARNTRQCLNGYRNFRHVIRNLYTFNLRFDRVQELVAELRPCLDAATRDLTAFADFLDNAARIIADDE